MALISQILAVRRRRRAHRMLQPNGVKLRPTTTTRLTITARQGRRRRTLVLVPRGVRTASMAPSIQALTTRHRSCTTQTASRKPVRLISTMIHRHPLSTGHRNPTTKTATSTHLRSLSTVTPSRLLPTRHRSRATKTGSRRQLRLAGLRKSRTFMRNLVSLPTTSVMPLTTISPTRLRDSRSRGNVGGAEAAGADPGTVVADPWTAVAEPGTFIR